jgi:HD-GYP domain-containing protein (c-di-GMP phosphodiesterase class II)
MPRRACRKTRKRTKGLQENPEADDFGPDAIAALELAVASLTSAEDEVVLTVTSGGFYVGTSALPQSTVEFSGLLNCMRERGIDSVTFVSDPTVTDLTDLVGFVAGSSRRIPTGGTVRLNERPYGAVELDGASMNDLRRAYADSLDTLRTVSRGGGLELDRVAAVVDGFLAGGTAVIDDSLLLATVRSHDETTFYHSVNVCLLSLALGRLVGLGDEDLRLLGTGALLHDLGRVILDDPGLHKMGRLTNHEWTQVRLHPQEGAEAILAVAGPGQETAALVALEHHLRIDGGGYPVLGGRIPHLFSRIVSVADGYEAMTSLRPYRSAYTPQQALHMVMEGSGTAYDPDLVAVFARMLGHYPPGSLLRLDSGEVVVVTGGDAEASRAVVVRDGEGIAVEPGERFELDRDRVVAHLAAADTGIDTSELIEVPLDPQRGGS